MGWIVGNVPIMQMALPIVEKLDNKTKRYIWSLLSYISTISGNLTICGSASNIIVAEKANRSGQNIQFYNFFQNCFFITLYCNLVGGILITGINMIENSFIH